MESEVLVHVERETLVESIHRGHIAVVHFDCTIGKVVGNSKHLTYIRSTAKPFQAIPLIESGAADYFRLNDQEIALICSSHSGQNFHVDGVDSILEKIGLNRSYLRCGIHLPKHQATADQMLANNEKPQSIHHNCSGKHAGMLALGKYLGADISSYLQPTHPVQQKIQQMVSEMCELQAQDMIIGTDGCGVPAFAMPLYSLAVGLNNMFGDHNHSASHKMASQRIMEAITKNPKYVAGDERLDTRLMEVTGSRLISKSGAEGMNVIVAPEQGIGVVTKVEDGSIRALNPSIIEALVQLDLLTPQEQEQLADDHKPKMLNHAGKIVGDIKPVFTLH